MRLGELHLVGRQANAQADPQLGDLRVAVAAEHFPQTLHHIAGLFQRNVREDHAELVATVAARQVIFPHVALQFLAQLSQHSVTNDMAIGVVDLLEVVDIDQRNGGLGLLLLALVELQLQQVFPGAVIEQAGEAVGTAQALRARLCSESLMAKR